MVACTFTCSMETALPYHAVERETGGVDLWVHGPFFEEDGSEKRIPWSGWLLL